MNYKDTLMYKEIAQTPAALAGIIDKNKNVMERLVKEIKERDIRFITGAARGTSDHALVLFKYLAEIYTKATVSLAACSIVTVYDGCIDFGGQLVIGVSQSGKAVDVLHILKRANEQGALTLAVTNNEESPMAKEAKYHLFCACGEEKSVAATKTFSSQMFLLTWLVASLSGNSELLKGLEALGSELSKEIGQIEEAAEPLAQKLYMAEDGFILSRGLTYSIALESMLKLQETSYIKMKAYAFSDFQHGPMAMISSGTPVVFIAPNAPYLADLKDVANKLKGFGGDVSIVTSVKNEFKDFDSVYGIKADANEALSVFRFALFIQLLACKVSCKKGNNPDSPRALNKITITK